MMSHYFPQEILIEILSRLPAKSIGKCRCASKPWRDLLCTSKFIKTHFTLKAHQENLIIITPSHDIHIIPITQDAAFSRKLNFLPDNTWTEVVGSCNGLVLLLNEENEMFLVNPITQQQVSILDSPLALNKRESFSMYGFGYDSSSDDYKIVTLSYYNTDNEYEPDCIDTFVDLYSVKKGVWKRLESSPYDHAVPSLASGAFVNGAIHWLASSRESGYPSVIAALDLADEVFNEIPAPNDADIEKFVFNKLVVLEGCLCMLDSRSGDEIDIWMMKEYGVKESWTKFSINAADCEEEIIKPLCLIGDDHEVVLQNEAESLVAYNTKNGTFREMTVDGVPAMVLDSGTFVESLVSPDFSNQN